MGDKGGKKVKEAAPAAAETPKTEAPFEPGQATPAQVIEVIGRVGVRGEATQVRCKILDGPDRGKIMRRNVRGPIRVDDILMLMETEMEAMQLKGGRGA